MYIEVFFFSMQIYIYIYILFFILFTGKAENDVGGYSLVIKLEGFNLTANKIIKQAPKKIN
jgi:hypothetical protein